MEIADDREPADAIQRAHGWTRASGRDFSHNLDSATRCLIPHGYDAHRIDGFNASIRANKALDKKSTSRHSLVHDLLD